MLFSTKLLGSAFSKFWENVFESRDSSPWYINCSILSNFLVNPRKMLYALFVLVAFHPSFSLSYSYSSMPGNTADIDFQAHVSEKKTKIWGKDYFEEK